MSELEKNVRLVVGLDNEIARLKAEINRVRAENVSLRDGNNELVDHNAVLSAENEKLLAENAALRGLVNDAERVRAILASTDPPKETEGK